MTIIRPPVKITSSFIVTLLILFLLGSTIHSRQISCDSIYSEKEFSKCLSRAKEGDPDAAFNIAKLYDNPPFSPGRFNISKDRASAFYWYIIAADLGNEKAVRIVFDSYYFGRYGSENKSEADHYLKQGAKLGHQWAMLLLANRIQKQDPEEAMNLYLDLALKDNCHAQRKLAKIYFEGDLVYQDLCKSYFRALLASVGDVDYIGRHSDCHFLAGTSEDSLVSTRCGPRLIGNKFKTEEALGSRNLQLVQDAAAKWKKGDPVPDFPIVQISKKDEPAINKIKPPGTLDLSSSTKKKKPIKWIPIQVEKYRQVTSEITASELFNRTNESVWTVISTSSAVNLKAMNNISLASGIAISENKLLTNYHVIEDRPYVVIKNGDRFEKAEIFSGDKLTDRCILHVENSTLKPIQGFRKFESLDVGEIVYSVGSPQGLENTLGQGIISGKRELNSLKLIQTTAQISKGSSGGGLFDRFGNLIGITTFKLADSEGLNFAISIDNFTR